jgi:hypothetical protein
VDDDIALQIEHWNIGTKPFLSGRARDLIDRHRFIAHPGCCAAGKKELDRLEQPTSPISGRGDTAPQQRFVHIVMKNVAKTPKIVPAQRKAEILGDRVTDAVGMAKPLALDELAGQRIAARRRQ